MATSAPSPLEIAAFADALGGLVGVIKPLVESLSAGGALGALTLGIGTAVNSLNSLVGVIKPFVEAISPSTVLAFNQAFRDVQATIGSALIGPLNILTETFRQMGGVLLPVVQQLEPVFRTLAVAVSDQLLAAVKALAAILESLTPLLQIFADAQKEASKFLLDLVSVFVAAVRVIKDALVGFFGGGDLKDVFKGFVDILRQVVKALVTFAATLAVFAGFRDTVKAFSVALAKEAKDREAAAGGLKAAATNPQITDIANLLKQQQLAAFVAGGAGGGRDKTDTEWLKDIADSLKDTAATKKTFQEAISDWWKTEVTGGNAGILGKVMNFIDTISGRILNFFARYFP